jgi:hypothetical protein
MIPKRWILSVQGGYEALSGLRGLLDIALRHRSFDRKSLERVGSRVTMLSALLVCGGFGAGGLFIVDPTLLFVQPIRGGIRARQAKSPSTYSGYF